jgi:uncharacterized protein (DUF2267 family)
MQYDEFINRVQQYANIDNRAYAERMTRVFLATLGEPLSREETVGLAAQLPKELKDALTETQPLETALSDTFKIDLEEFYNRLKGRLDVPYAEAVRQAKAVSRVLREAVSGGQIGDVVRDLSEDWQELFRA